MVQYILNLGKYDQNYDIRDRTRFIRQLIVPNEKSGVLSKYARRILLAPKPAPVLQSAFKGTLMLLLLSLSLSAFSLLVKEYFIIIDLLRGLATMWTKKKVNWLAKRKYVMSLHEMSDLSMYKHLASTLGSYSFTVLSFVFLWFAKTFNVYFVQPCKPQYFTNYNPHLSPVLFSNFFIACFHVSFTQIGIVFSSEHCPTLWTLKPQAIWSYLIGRRWLLTNLWEMWRWWKR